MSEDVDWARVTALLDDLYTAADGLERIFPGRKFTLDGHIVGSIGTIIGPISVIKAPLNAGKNIGIIIAPTGGKQRSSNGDGHKSIQHEVSFYCLGSYRA